MTAVARAHTITGWTKLEAELDAWLQADACASFWWRDDDATRSGPRLERLLAIAASRPIALAVIPSRATSGLAELLQAFSTVTVLQHGYAHTNHAPPGARKAEFGNHRPMETMRAEIRAGRDRIATLFGDRFVSVFVPPWNRFAPDLPAMLDAASLQGLSAFGPRPNGGHRQVNCHVDIVDWRGSRGFVGAGTALARLSDHLAARRTRSVDADEPTGLLTHHLVHDAECWRFLEDLTAFVDGHPAAAWVAAAGPEPLR